ncbi:MAG: caspase, partial [Xanthomonadales bacterium]|nr:caspase [Xanthomonadales bacterium]
SELESFSQTRGTKESQSGWAKLPRGRHVVISACQSDEEAKEISIDGQTRGVFSYYLMETLQSGNSAWTYRDLFARVNSMVRTKVSRQSPVIEATEFSDLEQPFLGGAVRQSAAYFTVSFDPQSGWGIDAGTINGIPAVQQDDTTHLAVFPVDAIDLEATDLAIGSASVIKRQSTSSSIELSLNDGSDADTSVIYKAVVTSLPVPPLGVRLEGDGDALQLVRDALDRAAAAGTYAQVCEVESSEDLRLFARDNRYLIGRAGDDRPLHAVIEGWSAEQAANAVENLEHIGRWMRMASLHNPSSRLPSNAVTLDCYVVGNNGDLDPVDLAGQGSELRLFYDYRDEAWHEPEIKIKLTNNSSRRLYCMLFDLSDRFVIWAEGLLPGGGEWLEPGEEIWACNGDAVNVSVPEDLWKNGMTEYKDLLKVVASTESCDASRFQQGALGMRYEQPATRGAAPNSLERLMQRTMTREIGGPPSSTPDRFTDWATAELSVTTVRPLEGASLPTAGQQQSLSPQITVNGHAALKANIRLTTVPLASRDMNQAPPLPSWLRDDPSQIQPFNLAPSRSVEAGLSVLELTGVSEHESVTKEQPLTLNLDTRLGSNDHLLTLAFDPESELYLPLGRATSTENGVEIRIERLPAPASSSRSLSGSIKIFFQKVICEKLGRDFEYPILAAADSHSKQTSDMSEVAARVAESSNIVLYVHGITGDTRGMVKSAFDTDSALSSSPVGSRYDLVLTFDYENLNTTIQDNALSLKSRLEQVGLGADHDKTLTIVAHSMGGLVSRWFIERLEGNKVVEHLVMLGTPNGGSPWSAAEDWLVAAIGVGMNGLSSIIWPAEILGSLMAKFEESVGTSLAQMNKDSDFLKDLASSPDPGVRYSIIAGNTSLLAAALLAKDGSGSSRIKQLFEKLNLQNVLHATASLAFFGSPNDIAADVESIYGVPGFENLDPVRVVACDHMSYFTTIVGLEALHDSLSSQA